MRAEIVELANAALPYRSVGEKAMDESVLLSVFVHGRL